MKVDDSSNGPCNVMRVVKAVMPFHCNVRFQCKVSGEIFEIGRTLAGHVA